MATVGSAEVRIDADVAPMLRQIRRALKGINGTVNIDTKSATASLRKVTKEGDGLHKSLSRVERVGRSAIGAVGRFAANAGEGITNVTTALGAMAGRYIFLAAAAGVATVAAAKFLAAVAPGVLSVAAGALVVLAAGVALAIPAFQNFIPAVKGSEEALKKLTPAARDAATTLRSFSSVFSSIRVEAQETAFRGVGDALSGLRENLTRLNPQVLQVSAALNTAMLGALTAVNTRFGDVESIASSAGTTFTNLSGSIQPLVSGLLAIAAAGGRVAASFSDEVAARLERVGTALTTFADTGGVERSVSKASDAFSKIGDVISSLEPVFSSLLDLVKQFGQGFSEAFGGTEDINVSIRTFGESLKDFGPAAKDLGASVGNVAKGFQTLRPIILPIVNALAEVLRIVTSLNGAGVLIALSLILNKIGISFATQGRVISAFGGALRNAVSAAGRARIFSGLATAIRVVVVAIGALVGAVGGIAAAIIVIVALAAAFVAALFIFPEFRKKVMEVVEAVGGALVSAFQAVVGFFQQLPGKVMGFITPFVTAVITFFQQLPGKIINAIITLPGLLIEFFLTGLGTVLAAIITFVGEIIVFFITLPGKIIDAVSSLVSLLVDFFTGVFETVSNAVTTGITAVVGFFTALPGKIVAGLKALPGALATAASDAFIRFKSAVTTGIDTVLGLVGEVPGKIKGLLSDAGDILFQAGRNIIKGLIRGIEAMVEKVGGAISKVTKKIADALPGSPVKEGPLSGGHQPWMLGEKVSDMIATGIRAGVPAVRKATAEVARSAALPVPGVSGSGPGPRVVRNRTSNTNVSVNVVTGSTDGDVLASILGRRFLLGGS